MTDLFTKPMPVEVRKQLEDIRADLLGVAVNEVDAFLKEFFEKTWADCQRKHTVQTCTIEKDGTRTPKTVEVDGSPDFNGFDRVTCRYAKRIAKIRWTLWDLYHVARGEKPSLGDTSDEPDVEEDGPSE